MPREIDYSLARRAVLRDLRRGAVSKLDVCDAHPELLRAARSVGTVSPEACPVCGSRELRLVSYVYGDRLKRANGRCVIETELERPGAAHDEFSRYVVEVCLDCSWNYLRRTSLLGRRHAGGASRAAPPAAAPHGAGEAAALGGPDVPAPTGGTWQGPAGSR